MAGDGSVSCIEDGPKLVEMVEEKSDRFRNKEQDREIVEQRSWEDLLGIRVFSFQEINDKVTDVPIGASTSTPKTTTISSVTTKGITIIWQHHSNGLEEANQC
ncbi:hypothetical protein SUGI_0423520 [Cryptomeria japonica]|nr:hypothetical protein SUGI_0423520 [Cryptomeria japonica]